MRKSDPIVGRCKFNRESGQRFLLSGPLERRGFIESCSAILIACLAGCAGQIGDAESSNSNGEIEGTSYDQDALVVNLSGEPGISKINLIGPDGSHFTSVEVPEGATRVRIPIIDVNTGWHYTIGEHELVAVSAEKQDSTTVDLRPKLKLVGFRQYSEGRPTPSNRGNLVTSVENTGTAPTWISYIGYEDAPYERANTLSSSNEYSPEKLFLPQTPQETIIPPGGSVDFVGATPPFIIGNSDECDEWQTQTTVIAQAGSGEKISKRIRATFSGDRLSANFQDACSSVEVEPIDGGSTDE